MHAAIDPISVHVWVDPPAKVQAVLGAVQKLPKPVQQGCPIPPQVPHDPLVHMVPAMLPHIWPLAVQRLAGLLMAERTQQPPAWQALFAQQG